MALLLLFLPFAVSISASSPKLPTAPSSLVAATLPLQLSAPPAWTKSEVKTCSPDFSRGKIDPWDCLQALTKVPSGSAPVRFDRKAPKGATNSLPFHAIHGEYTPALPIVCRCWRWMLHFKNHARWNSKFLAVMHLASAQSSSGHPRYARWYLSLPKYACYRIK